MVEAGSVASRVRRVLVMHTGIELDKLTDEARLIEDVGCDNLDLVEIIMALEDEFIVHISDDEAEKVRTVRDAVNLAERLTSERAAA